MKKYLKKSRYLILSLIVGYALFVAIVGRNVEVVFVNSTTNKIPELSLFIDGEFHSKFYCVPGMIPTDFIEIKLPVGKHSMRVESLFPEQSWISTFWVIKNEYYQFYMRDNMGESDSLIITFDRSIFPPVFQ